MTSQKPKNVIRRILAMKFMSEFLFINPLITIMYRDQGSVDAAGIGIILAVGFIGSVLFEIPTGVISDKFPRKYVILSALFINAMAFSMWIIFPFFWGYIASAILFALGFALESGSWQAYLYGVLPKEDKKNFGKYWARVTAMVMASFTIAYGLSYFAGVRFNLLIGLSIISVVVSILIGISLPKDTVTSSHEEKPRIFRSAITHILTSKPLLKLLLSALIVVGMAGIGIEYITLYFNQSGVDERYVGLLLAAANILGAISFWTLHSWEHILEKHKIAFMVLGLVIYVGSFYGGVAAAVVGMILFTRFVRVLEVQFESNIQHVSNDKSRATISSIGSFGSKIVTSAGVLLIGFAATNDIIVGPLRATFIGLAVSFILLHSFLRYKRRGQAIYQ